ncbi:MAG: hypothetical protein IPJ90_08465 [Anaerolineaceae bacterium]|nr:hypothetical protein [Anaerolineaceae bacterium]
MNYSMLGSLIFPVEGTKWLEKSFQNSLSTDFADFADLGGKICDDYFSKTFCTLLKSFFTPKMGCCLCLFGGLQD